MAMHLHSFLKTICQLLICNLALLDRLPGWNYCTSALFLLFHSVVWADARAVRPYMLTAFSDVKASEVWGKYWYVTNKPHGGFVVYPLFVLYILNTHIVNRMAVSLFIGQGWRTTSTLSPSNEQEINAKGVAFSSDKRFSNFRWKVFYRLTASGI